jgi:hypothetical protein
MVAQVRVRGIAGAAHRRDASMGKRVSPASRSPSTRRSKSSRIDQLRGDPDPVARLVRCLQHVADAQRLGHVRHRDRCSLVNEGRVTRDRAAWRGRSVAQQRSKTEPYRSSPVSSSVETSQKGVTHRLHYAGVSDHGKLSKIRYRPKQRSRTAGQRQW